MTRVPSRPPRTAAVALAVAQVVSLLVAAGCAREIVGSPPPLDRPHFPRGIAVHPERPVLAVVSSNFDLEFNRGAILLADLAAVDAAIADGEGRFLQLAGSTSPYTSVALVPSFGNDPVFVQGGSRLLLPSQDQNRVSEIPLALDDEAVDFDCASVASDTERPVPVCGEATESLQLPGNDPFELAVIEDSDERVSAIVTLLNSPDLFYVRLNDDEGAGRLTIDRGPSFTLEGYSDRGDALGVRGIGLWPSRGGVRTTAFLTVTRTSAFTFSAQAVDLVWFDAAQGRGAPLGVLRLTDEVGSLEARDVAVAPDGSAVFVILRDPDAIARVDVTPTGGALDVRLGGIATSCYDPIELEVVAIPTPAGGEVTRVLATCFDNDTIVAYDPFTLVETEVVRRLADGPYGLAVDVEHDPPRAYVSFFNDDRVAVIDLVDDDGNVALVPRALIGAPREAVETAE